MVVDRVCSKKEAEKLLGIDDLWNAEEHILASTATPKDFTLEVPVKVAKRLRFITSSKSKTLRFVDDTHLDKQTLRSVRQLEPASASFLDELLPPNTSAQ